LINLLSKGSQTVDFISHILVLLMPFVNWVPSNESGCYLSVAGIAAGDLSIGNWLSQWHTYVSTHTGAHGGVQWWALIPIGVKRERK